MTAIDDFESFENFMENAVAGDDSSDGDYGCAAADDDRSNGAEEEGKRCWRQKDQEEESERDCRQATDDAARSRRK